MPPFRSPNEYPAAERPLRKALAEARAKQRAAEQNARNCEIGESKAFDQLLQAERRLDELRAEIDERPERDADAFLSRLDDDGDVLVADSELEGKIVEAERTVTALRDVRDRLGSRIAPAKEAAALARMTLESRAKAVLASTVNVPALLGAAAETIAAVRALDAELIAVSRILPDGPEQRAIADFLARGWNSPNADAWQRHPAAVRYFETLERLKADAAAPIPRKDAP